MKPGDKIIVLDDHDWKESFRQEVVLPRLVLTVAEVEYDGNYVKTVPIFKPGWDIWWRDGFTFLIDEIQVVNPTCPMEVNNEIQRR